MLYQKCKSKQSVSGKTFYLTGRQLALSACSGRKTSPALYHIGVFDFIFLGIIQPILVSTYPFTLHRFPYQTAVNKMPTFCVMAKECDIFSFELTEAC